MSFLVQSYTCKTFSILIGPVIPVQKFVIPVQITKFKNFDLPYLRLDLNTFFTVYNVTLTENGTGICEATDLVKNV